MPHLMASLVYISRSVSARITKFYRHMPYIETGYDITSYLRSEVTAK